MGEKLTKIALYAIGGATVTTDGTGDAEVVLPTGSIATGTAALTVASASTFAVGQGVFVTGAGAAGGHRQQLVRGIGRPEAHRGHPHRRHAVGLGGQRIRTVRHPSTLCPLFC